ncbi:MAG: sialate O-acetylesterase, partial [Verrucomicrobiota bacterium]
MRILLLILFCVVSAHAAVKPHGLFSKGGVLQQGTEVPVWGTAAAGEKITVQFQGQTVSAVTK